MFELDDCDCRTKLLVKFTGKPGGISKCGLSMFPVPGVDRDLGFVLPDGMSKSSPFGPPAITVVGSAGTCAMGSGTLADDNGLLAIFAIND